MSAIAEVKFQIRRALQIPLEQVCNAQPTKIPVLWPGTTIDRQKNSVYVKQSISWGDVKVLEIGKTPRFQANGGYNIVVCSKEAFGEDLNDQVAGIIAAGYPYGEPLTFDGISVIVDKIRPGAYGNDGPWITGMIIVDWYIFRRP